MTEKIGSISSASIRFACRFDQFPFQAALRHNTRWRRQRLAALCNIGLDRSAGAGGRGDGADGDNDDD